MTDLKLIMMQKFYIIVSGKAVTEWDDDEMLEYLYNLAVSPVMLQEVIGLLQY